jgi:hypothetical protein
VCARTRRKKERERKEREKRERWGETACTTTAPIAACFECEPSLYMHVRVIWPDTTQFFGIEGRVTGGVLGSVIERERERERESKRESVRVRARERKRKRERARKRAKGTVGVRETRF